MSGLCKVFDCMMLSLCWIIAGGALYRTVYRCIRHDDGDTLKVFWQTWRKNLKNGILTWLPVMAVYAFLIFDAMVLRGLVSQGQPMARLFGIVMVLIGVASVWAAYCTAYCVRFEGSLKEVLWLSFYLVLAHPAMTLVVLMFLAMGAALALLVPFLTLFLPAGICLAISFPMEKVFLTHMRPEDVAKAQNGQ